MVKPPNDDIEKEIQIGALRSHITQERSHTELGLEACFAGNQEIAFEKLLPPDGDHICYRARTTTSHRVDHLTTSLAAESNGHLSSIITVVQVEDGDAYVVLDGNHRYEAMQRLWLEQPSWFASVLCRVYKNLQVYQALALCYTTNSQSESIHPMTDYTKVTIARKVICHWLLQPRLVVHLTRKLFIVRSTSA